MADQLMFEGCDKPNSSLKLNWAFGRSWPGENAHAGVGVLPARKLTEFVPVSQTWNFELKKQMLWASHLKSKS